MKRVLTILLKLLPLILSIVGCIITKCKGESWFILPTNDNSFHFSLITVNALFGGFLYTNYSLLIGLLDNAIIKKVKNTRIIAKRNSHIISGIIYATVSVMAGLFLIFFTPSTPASKSLFINFIQNVEIVFMVFLIIYFMLSLYEMHILVKNTNNPQAIRSREEIEVLRDEIHEQAQNSND